MLIDNLRKQIEELEKKLKTNDAANTQQADMISDLRKKLKEAQAFADDLSKKSVTVGIKIGTGGRAFGSVSTKEIAEAAKEQLGVELDRKKMNLEAPLRELGESTVQVRVHPKVTANLKVIVKEI